jgi:hypothetical protein
MREATTIISSQLLNDHFKRARDTIEKSLTVLNKLRAVIVVESKKVILVCAHHSPKMKIIMNFNSNLSVNAFFA